MPRVASATVLVAATVLLGACGAATTPTAQPTSTPATTPHRRPRRRRWPRAALLTGCALRQPRPRPRRWSRAALATVGRAAFHRPLRPSYGLRSVDAGWLYADRKPRGTGANGAKTCTYSTNHPWNIFGVLVFPAPDAATAQADWAQEVAAEQNFLDLSEPWGGPAWNLTLSDATVPGADKAAVGTSTVPWAGGTIKAAAIYALKGSTFVGLTDLVGGQGLTCTGCGDAGPAPTTTALEAQMATTLGRLP